MCFKDRNQKIIVCDKDSITFDLFINQGYDENNMFVIDWAAMFDDENQGKNFLM